MKNSARALVTVIFFCSFLVSQAQEKPTHHEEHYHLSGFAGFTSDYAGRNGYKLGVEYEYRVSDLLGVGGTFDFTGADFRIFALSAGVTLYPFQFPLVIGLGTGAKHKDEKWKSFSRAMLIYDFHVNSISIGPMIMYDFFPGQKDIMSYGVTVGFSL